MSQEGISTTVRYCNIRDRILSSVVMLVLVVCMFFGNSAIGIFVVAIAGIIMINEWYVIVHGTNSGIHMLGVSLTSLAHIFVVAATTGFFPVSHCIKVIVFLMGFSIFFDSIVTKEVRSILWLIVGKIIILAGCALFLFAFEGGDTRQFAIIICVIAVSSDTGGFVGGKLIGGPLLAPKISPNKTWSGALVGIILSIISGLMVMHYDTTLDCMYVIMLSFLLSLISQAGDLLESSGKRAFGVKDSGCIIPGHGGVLDRCDGLLALSVIAIPCMTLMREHFSIFGI